MSAAALNAPEQIKIGFLPSRPPSHQAVQEGFRLLEATAAEIFHAPSITTSTSTELSASGSETRSETQGESDDEFADVLEWSDDQVGGLE